MRAILLAGGLGTRLRPLTFAVPKPLIPVGDKPVLEIILNTLKSFGITDFYLALGYKAELIQAYFQDGSQFGVKIHYVREEKRLGTAGPLRLVRDRFTIKEPILVMNSDIITEADFGDLYAFHLREHAELTVAVRHYTYTVPYGVLELDGAQVLSIRERPVRDFEISCGIYVISPHLFDLVPEGEFFDMPQLICRAIDQRHRVSAYYIRQKWLAIETLQHLVDEAGGNWGGLSSG